MDNERVEMIKLYWEEFKYRHEHYWKVFFKFSLAILFLLVVPYVHPDKITSLRDFVFIFPLAGILVSIAGSWILAAENKRLSAAGQRLSGLKSPEYKPISFAKENFSGKLLGFRIGIVVSWVFFLGFLALSVIELALICKCSYPLP